MRTTRSCWTTPSGNFSLGPARPPCSGLTPVALRLLASLAPAGLDRAGGMLVVATDAEKEDLLCDALPFITGTPKVIVAG